MDKKSRLSKFIEGVFHAQYDIVIGYEIDAGAIAIHPGVGQYILVDVCILFVTDVSPITEEIQVKGIGNMAEFFREEIRMHISLRYQFIFQVQFSETVFLAVGDVIFIPANK